MNMRMTDTALKDVDLTYDESKLTEQEADEKKQVIRENEPDLLTALLDAADITEEAQQIDIIRGEKTLFSFKVHPLTEEQLGDIRKKYTKIEKNRRSGLRVPGELDTAKYRASLIYNSTVDEDKTKIWDNRKLWRGLESKGKVILNALDVIDAILLPGEKDRVLDIIDQINGYGSEDIKLQEAAKN